MNNSKENILKRIAAAGMPEYAYPDFGYEPQHFDDPATMFAQRLRAAGARPYGWTGQRRSMRSYAAATPMRRVSLRHCPK